MSGTPGSSIEISSSPTGWTVASETPSALTRFWSTGMVSAWACATLIPLRIPHRQLDSGGLS